MPACVPAQLRRALQSERHVLCVHPPDQTPEIAYEAAMIRNDTGCVLMPLLPEATHPAIRRLAEFVRRKEASGSPIGVFRLLEMERGVEGEVLDGVWIPGHKPSFPGWDIFANHWRRDSGSVGVRRAGGTARGRAGAGRRSFRAGRIISRQPAARQQQPSWRLTAIGSDGRVGVAVSPGLERSGHPRLARRGRRAA